MARDLHTIICVNQANKFAGTVAPVAWMVTSGASTRDALAPRSGG